jgi:hypothetical protein
MGYGFGRIALKIVLMNMTRKLEKKYVEASSDEE